MMLGKIKLTAITTLNFNQSFFLHKRIISYTYARSYDGHNGSNGKAKEKVIKIKNYCRLSLSALIAEQWCANL